MSAGNLYKPIVTIGVCVRNCASTISETIESIIAQDYPEEYMEVIFVDDGSEDETLSLIKEYLPKMRGQVKIFHHKWRGIGYSRNIVLKNAKGDYILWLDGDMVVPKNYVRKLVEFMSNHPKVGIVKGKQSLKSGAGLWGTLEAYSRAASRMINYRSEKAKNKALGTGGAIYRVSALKEVGGFDEKIKGYGEDLDVEMKIRAKGWIIDVADVKFFDYERYGVSLKKLWERYWLRGYYSHYLFHKDNRAIRLYGMLPLSAVLVGFQHALKIYKVTKDIAAFALPLFYLFKFSAWWIGFLNSHKDSYMPK